MRLTRAACFLGWHIDGNPRSFARVFYSSLHGYWPISIVSAYYLPRTPPQQALACPWCCGSAALQTAMSPRRSVLGGRLSDTYRANKGYKLYTSTLSSKFLERCRYFGKFLGIFAFLRLMQPIVVSCSANLYVGERLRDHPLIERICGGFDIVRLIW